MVRSEKKEDLFASELDFEGGDDWMDWVDPWMIRTHFPLKSEFGCKVIVIFSAVLHSLRAFLTKTDNYEFLSRDKSSF